MKVYVVTTYGDSGHDHQIENVFTDPALAELAARALGGQSKSSMPTLRPARKAPYG